MKTIHIALVGGQTYPVYLAIANEKPDEVLYVHSNKTKAQAERIASMFDIPHDFVYLDPVDIDDVFTYVEEFYSKIEQNVNYTINLTGGTKIWSIAFFKYFSDKDNVNLIYVDQNNISYDLKTRESYEVNVTVDIKTLMQLNNHNPSYRLFSEYTVDDLKVLKKIEEIRRWNIPAFNKLTMLNSTILSRKVNNLEEGNSWISWDRNNGEVRIAIANKHGIKDILFTNPHIFEMLFNTGWFEYKVAQIMSEWKYAEEIWMNVVFPASNKISKNEIDIIVKAWNKFIFIECKTQVYTITDIDKFNNAVKNFGGLGCKALFITDAKPTSEVEEKFRDSGVLHFALQDYASINIAKKSLIDFLETELFDISPR